MEAKKSFSANGRINHQVQQGRNKSAGQGNETKRNNSLPRRDFSSCLVAIEADSNYILLEEYSGGRKGSDWTDAMKEAENSQSKSFSPPAMKEKVSCLMLRKALAHIIHRISFMFNMKL